MTNAIALLVWLGLSFSAGFFGSQFKPGDWYASLKKPAWTPPSIAFPVAWSILYILMSVSAWMVWKERGSDPFVTPALTVFGIQLVLNAAWSWIFFGRHSMGWALLEMVGLWLMIALAACLFWKVSPTAGRLLVPYLIWVSFALVLNWGIWKRN